MSKPAQTLPRFIGMIHLDALPGAPRFGGRIETVVAHAIADARALVDGGVDGIMVENFHDTPFFRGALPPITVAALTRCALAVRETAPNVPLGINALRNDGLSALAVAEAVGASFIRVNVLCGAMITDQGLIEGDAAELIRARAAWARGIQVFADVAVKHASPLAPLDLAQMAKDTVLRGHADALIVSGSGTGQPASPDDLTQVHTAVPSAPIYIGSGVTVETVSQLKADGFIVGTAIKRDGRVDPTAVAAVRAAIDQAQAQAQASAHA